MMKLLDEVVGYKYTQADEVEVQDRLFLTKIYLANESDVDKWKLITDAEAEQAEKLQQIEIERMQLNNDM